MYKKRGGARIVLLMICSIVLCSYLVHGETTQSIFEEDVTRGFEFLPKNSKTPFIFNYGDGSVYEYRHELMVVTFPDTSTLPINKGECETKGFYNVCYDSVNLSHFDIETGSYVYNAHVRLYALVASLEVTRSVIPASILPSEFSKVKIELNNTGSYKASNVHFTEQIPPEFVILNYSGCSIGPQSVFWNGVVDIGTMHTCYYTLKGKSPVAFNDSLTVMYNNGLESKKVIVKGSLQVEEFRLKIDPELSKDTFRVGESTNFMLNLTNIGEDDDITVVEFVVSFPKNVRIVHSSVAMPNNTLKWNGRLTPGKSQLFDFTLRAHETGKNSITSKGSYILGSIFSNIPKHHTVSVPFTIFVDHLKLNPLFDTTVVGLGGKIEVEVDVINPNTSSTFNNVTVELSAPFLETVRIHKIGEIPTLQQRKIRETLQIPDFLTHTTYDVMITVFYNWFDEQFLVTHNQSITIEGVTQGGVTQGGVTQGGVTQGSTEGIQDPVITQEEEGIDVAIKVKEPADLDVPTGQEERESVKTIRGSSKLPTVSTVIYLVVILVQLFLILLVIRYIRR